MGPRKLLSIFDVSATLVIMAYLIGHEDEYARDLGGAFVVSTALGIVEFTNYLKHVQSCPDCVFDEELLIERLSV